MWLFRKLRMQVSQNLKFGFGSQWETNFLGGRRPEGTEKNLMKYINV